MDVYSQPEGDWRNDLVSKVPLVTIGFWVIKILATTVGETGGDALSMTLNLGYAVSSLVFIGFFVIALAAQVTSRRYHPFAYWAVVVATTTVGTTMSDYLDRTVGLGYIKSSIILFCGVVVVLLVWRSVSGAIEFENIATRKNEVFYWVTILVSNTLGTALGDFVATSAGLGFERGALVFAGLIGLVALVHLFTDVPEKRALLGRICSDPSTRSYTWRHPYQATRRRRNGPEPYRVFTDYRYTHGRGDNSHVQEN